MSNTVESPREILVRGYIKGRIPFRIWFFSALSGSVVMILFNLLHHEAILQGFFSVLFLNLAITLPLFLAQAHFVGKTLQKNYKRTKSTLVAVLMIGWLVTGIAIGFGLRSVYQGQMNFGIVVMIINYNLQLIAWVVLSYFTTVRKVSLYRQSER